MRSPRSIPISPSSRGSHGVLALTLLVLSACGGATGSTASVDGGGDAGDGGTPQQPPAPLCPVHRSGTPAPRPSTSCPATSVTGIGPVVDGGAVSCTTDADCMGDGVFQWCRGGQCQVDECLGDSDCPGGQACICANEQSHNAIGGNRCEPSGCRVDADCAAQGGTVCGPIPAVQCSGVTGFACHSSADTCNDDSDCCPDAPLCAYDALFGRWSCQPQMVCSG